MVFVISLIAFHVLLLCLHLFVFISFVLSFIRDKKNMYLLRMQSKTQMSKSTKFSRIIFHSAINLLLEKNM